jgi:uncharacterized protein YbjT (DUF2867 family)
MKVNQGAIVRILLTGANGYIGKRILPLLVAAGHTVVCCVRDKGRFQVPVGLSAHIEVVEADLLKDDLQVRLPNAIDIAFYLVHSMAAGIGDFFASEARAAQAFVAYSEKSQIRQIIYLSGLKPSGERTSEHLKSRLNVEQILLKGPVPATVLRAGIVVGSGSASFEIIRDLVEKLPVMITPRWLNSKVQPIAVRDVLALLLAVMDNKDCFDEAFDIGGEEILTYKDMLLQYADVRQLKRYIFTLPVMTPRLSSYWLYFITSTSYNLAVNLVNSMKLDVVCGERRLIEMLGYHTKTYQEAIRLAFGRIAADQVVSSWKDAYLSDAIRDRLNQRIEVPQFGVLTDRQTIPIPAAEVDRVKDNVWSIGGQRGWYYGNFLWRIRGFLDKLAGGVGLRRGRTNVHTINQGDALDFWRVLDASEDKSRLLLMAEMKLPGEAWLEFVITNGESKPELRQTATFRPRGLFGRLYWYALWPFHLFIFRNMAERIVAYRE